MRSLNENYFVGIDVGTGSARAGVFDGNGNLKGSVSAPIQMWKPARDFVEQSSDDLEKMLRSGSGGCGKGRDLS